MLPIVPANTHVQIAREFTSALQADNALDAKPSSISGLRAPVVRMRDTLAAFTRRVRIGEPGEAAVNNWIRAAGQVSARR
jgi:hypothetical protein